MGFSKLPLDGTHANTIFEYNAIGHNRVSLALLPLENFEEKFLSA